MINRHRRNPKHIERKALRNRKRKERPRLWFEKCEARMLLAASFGTEGSEPWGPTLVSNLVFEPAVILKQLADHPGTAGLQRRGNELKLIDYAEKESGITSLFQQFHRGIPVDGAYVTVVQGGEDSFASYNRGDASLQTNVALEPSLSSDQAFALAIDAYELDAVTTSAVSLVWHAAETEALLAWRIDSNHVSGKVDFAKTILVDAHSGAMLEQPISVGNDIDYLLEYPDTFTDIYPRIVINDAIGASGSQSYAAPFDSVVSISVGCTGTLIAPDVVLSARHCGINSGDVIRFGDNSGASIYTATVSSSFLPDGNGTLLDGGDVSILRLTQAVPANIATPMRLIDETSSLVGQVAATVGYGYNGVGSQGHGFSADGIRWGGENIIDVYGAPAATSGTNIFSTDFDNGTSSANTISSSSSIPLTFEATTAPGDSGGPILVRKGTEWVIAGVLSGGTTNTSVYGDISWWTGVAPFKADIEAFGGQFVGTATVSLDASSYVEGDDILITVDDFNATGSLQTLVTSASGDTETVTLSNVSGSTFAGSITLAGSSIVVQNGSLQASPNDVITVAYTDLDDGAGNSSTVSDQAVVLPGSVAQSESNVSGSIVSGSYLDTYVSDNVNEVLREERYGGRRSRLEHRWSFDVASGSDVTFHLEARRDGTSDEFRFDYSTNGGSSWIPMITVSDSAETSNTFSLGSGISGNTLVRVIDTNRSRGDSSLDTLYVDQMFFSSVTVDPTPGITASQTGGTTEVAEGGANDSYSIVLDTVPTADVTVTVTPDAQLDLGNGAAIPVQLLFTPSNALTPQFVTVTAVDDAEIESLHSGLITQAVASTDPDYGVLSLPVIDVVITDNDSTGGGNDVARGESTSDGEITQGSYLDTHASDDVREVISEERYAGNKRTRLQHQWNFNVSGGSQVVFYLEAYHDSSVEDFVFQYSTNNGSSWSTITTVVDSSEIAQSFNLGGNVAGDVLVRVLDTDRSRNEATIDSIYIDEMYFESVGNSSSSSNGATTESRSLRSFSMIGGPSFVSLRDDLSEDCQPASMEQVLTELVIDSIGEEKILSWNQQVDHLFSLAESEKDQMSTADSKTDSKVPICDALLV